MPPVGVKDDLGRAPPRRMSAMSSTFDQGAGLDRVQRPPDHPPRAGRPDSIQVHPALPGRAFRNNPESVVSRAYRDPDKTIHSPGRVNSSRWRGRCASFDNDFAGLDRNDDLGCRFHRNSGRQGHTAFGVDDPLRGELSVGCLQRPRAMSKASANHGCDARFFVSCLDRLQATDVLMHPGRDGALGVVVERVMEASPNCPLGRIEFQRSHIVVAPIATSYPLMGTSPW